MYQKIIINNCLIYHTCPNNCTPRSFVVHDVIEGLMEDWQCQMSHPLTSLHIFSEHHAHEGILTDRHLSVKQSFYYLNCLRRVFT